ncbi:hypothetical protein V2J09_003545 [Rumex salicifolius]
MALPLPSHCMCTRSKVGIIKPKFVFNLNTEIIPIPKTHKTTLQYDIILTASTAQFMMKIITAVSRVFAMSDLGPLHYFLGVSVKHQDKEILDQAGMSSCNPCKTQFDTNPKLSSQASEPIVDPTEYRSLAVSLLYLCFTRSGICYVV